MTTDRNIQDLANENKRLMAEYKALKEDNERLEAELTALKAPQAIAPKPDLSFTAHDDATSQGCQMCGSEWKSLNKEGYCSSCWTVWKS